MLTRSEFEDLLVRACQRLNEELASGSVFAKSSDFEQRVREVLEGLLTNSSLSVDFHPHLYRTRIPGHEAVLRGDPLSLSSVPRFTGR